MKITKNILAMILSIIMVFSNMIPALASEDNKPLKLSQVSVEKFENNQDAEVEFNAENTTDKSVSAKFIIGLYKKQDKSYEMISYNYVSDTLEPNEVKKWGACIPIPEKGAYKIKAFAWDKLTNPTLLSNEVTVEKASPMLTLEQQVEKAIDETSKAQLNHNAHPDFGMEWTILSLARGGYEVPSDYYENYYKVIVNKAKEEQQKSQGRWGNTVTDVERVAIALAAIGKDAQDVEGINLLDYIWNKEGNFPGIKPSGVLGSRQGSNELVFGLLALDANKAKKPENATISRDEIIHKLLDEYQIKDGGFGLGDNQTFNFDMTAMAIQALAPYYHEKSEVKVAVDKAINCLSNLQGEDGKYLVEFAGNTEKSSESIVQAIVALTSMNIDPHKDSRFVKNDNSLMTALLTYYAEGGFKHVIDGQKDGMATEQGLYGLIAYDRFVNHENSLYDMTDIESEQVNESIGKVYVSIEKRTIGKGDTVPRTEAEFYEGDSPFDIVKRIVDKNNIDMQYSDDNQYNSVYISSIAGDGEFDHGRSSGWMYEVNGKFPNVGMSAYENLKDKDVIRLRYTVSGIGGQDLTNHLVEVLKTQIQKSQELNEEEYTQDSFTKFKEALVNAQAIANDPQYDSQDTDKELRVSTEIGKLSAAVEGLVKISTQVEPHEWADDSVPDDFENDLWLNNDFKRMETGDTYQLNPRRVEEIIDNPINNRVTNPTYHYNVIKGDSVSVDNTGIITAKTLGTSIIEVSYDAISANGRNYGAISSVNKAYMVVDVVDGADKGIKIATNIKQRPYDTIYFDKGNHVNYDFTVNAQGSDEVVVTCNGQELKLNGNHYTAPLENRNNIIGIKASNDQGTQKMFYVIDARKIEVKIENASRKGEPIQVDDTVKISFRGITLPVYKLATIYNPTFPMSMFGESTTGTYVEYKNADLGTLKGQATQYDLATDNAITFTATKEGVYEFNNGHIYSSWWGDTLGSDREKIGQGQANLNANTNESDFSILPDIQVKVAKKDIIPATGIEIEESTSIEEKKSKTLIGKVLPETTTEQGIKWSSDNEAIATVNEEGIVTGVKAGVVTITAMSVDGKFTDTCTVTVTQETYASAEERQSLRESINEAKSKTEDEYGSSVWEKLQDQITTSESILNDDKSTSGEINEAKDNLLGVMAKKYGLNIEPKQIHAGDTVTITIPSITDPNGETAEELKTIYSTNIKGLDKVQSENAKNDSDLLKTIKFTIPDDTEDGVYTLTDGYVYKKWGGVMNPQFHQIVGQEIQHFYEGELPDIQIYVGSDTVTGEVYGNENTVTGEVYNITKDDLDQNGYDVFYYIKDQNYVIDHHPVTFISNDKIEYNGKNQDLKNKEVTYTIEAGVDNKITSGEMISIEFKGLEVPIGSVSGQWNSSYQGEIRTVYDTNLEGLSKIKSENGALNSIDIQIPQDASGTYHLTNGTIYEKANEWSHGIDGIGTDGYFGTLPDIVLTVE